MHRRMGEEGYFRLGDDPQNPDVIAWEKARNRETHERWLAFSAVSPLVRSTR